MRLPSKPAMLRVGPCLTPSVSAVSACLWGGGELNPLPFPEKVPSLSAGGRQGYMAVCDLR